MNRAAQEVFEAVADDPFVQRVLLDMHLALFEYFTHEWLEFAPVLVGNELTPFVGTLVGDQSLQEYFAESDVLPCVHYDQLLYLRQELRAANREYSHARSALNTASLAFHQHKVALRSFLANHSVPFTTRQLCADGERFMTTLPALSRAFYELERTLDRRLEVYIRLARMFGRGTILTEAWLGRTVTSGILDLFIA